MICRCYVELICPCKLASNARESQICLIYVGISCNTWPYTRYKFSEKLKLSFVFWTMRSRHYFLMLLILLILVLFLAYLWLLWFPIGKPSNESDEENSCLKWKAVTATVATILIRYLLYRHGEILWNAAHVYCWERLLTAGRGLFGHQDGNVTDQEEIMGERALTERCKTAGASHQNCNDGETTSLGTMESYSLTSNIAGPAWLPRVTPRGQTVASAIKYFLFFFLLLLL